MLINLKSQTAVSVIFDHLAETRIGGSVGGQALFAFGVAGMDFRETVIFVEIQLVDFSFLCIIFPGYGVGKSGRKSDRKAECCILSTFPICYPCIGLHHVFCMSFWQTAMGGTAIIGEVVVQGAQNIFFAELDSKTTTVFSVSATRFMFGMFP